MPQPTDDLLGLAANLQQGSAGDRLLRGALLQTEAVAVPDAPALTFEQAMAAFYAAAGIPAPADLSAPPAEVAAAVAPVITAHALALRLVDEAYAGLTPEERAHLLANLDALVLADDADPEVAALADRVQVGHMLAAAALLADAMSEFDASGLPEVRATWVDPTGLIEIGSTSNDAYYVERALIVDLGGNDWYENHAGSYAPGSFIIVPASAVLDVGGNDVYYTTGFHPSSVDTGWGQAVGMGGVGLIVDRWGDDFYYADVTNVPTPCTPDARLGSAHRQMLYAQAVGVVGVGVLADASGNDRYQASSVNVLPIPCHWAKAYVFAQAIGIHLGVGALLDDTGDDFYEAYAEEAGKDDNLAHAHCQAASAGGVALLADKEGSDAYFCRAYAHAIFNDPSFRYKGSFAHTFAQASNFATIERPLEFRASFPGTCIVIQDILDFCLAPIDVSITACSLSGREQGGSACLRVGSAVLVDLLGDDTFYATSTSVEPDPCFWASWAVTSAQGSSAWSGLAALVNLDVDGTDRFILDSYAEGGGCGVLHVRAHNYGQGYGGPIYWDFWDSPGSDSPGGVSPLPVPVPILAQSVWTPAVGILVSVAPPEGGTACPTGEPGGNVFQLPPTTIPKTCETIRRTVEGLLPPVVQQLVNAPDHYRSGAYASNTGQGYAFGESWVQGVGGSLAQTPPGYLTSYGPTRVFALLAYAELGVGTGIGIHVDLGGDDRFDSTAAADSPSGLAFPRSVAQGAGVYGVGVLANEGGHDAYDAYAYANGANDPRMTQAQAYAEGFVTVAMPCVLLCAPVTVPAVGILLEVGGWDAYSEAAESAPFPCQGNGVTLGGWPPLAPVLGPHVWGTVPATFPVACNPLPPSSGAALGVDAESEVPL